RAGDVSQVRDPAMPPERYACNGRGRGTLASREQDEVRGRSMVAFAVVVEGSVGEHPGLHPAAVRIQFRCVHMPVQPQRRWWPRRIRFVDHDDIRYPAPGSCRSQKRLACGFLLLGVIGVIVAEIARVIKSANGDRTEVSELV